MSDEITLQDLNRRLTDQELEIGRLNGVVSAITDKVSKLEQEQGQPLEALDVTKMCPGTNRAHSWKRESTTPVDNKGTHRWRCSNCGTFIFRPHAPE